MRSPMTILFLLVALIVLGVAARLPRNGRTGGVTQRTSPRDNMGPSHCGTTRTARTRAYRVRTLPTRRHGQP